MAEKLYYPAMGVTEIPSPPPGVLVTGHFREEFGYRVRRPGGSGNWLLTYTLDGAGLYRWSATRVLVCRIWRALEPGSGRGSASSSCALTRLARLNSHESWRSTAWKR